MKRIIIILIALGILLAGTALVSNAQQMQVKTYVEHTHISPKFGTALGWNLAGDVEVGGFFQQAADLAQPEYGRPLRVENQFYGAYFGYPMYAGRITEIKLNVRTGVSNGENFVITPSILANFKPTRNLSIGGGIGTRAFRPTFMASLSLNLSNATKYLANK